MAPAFSPGDGDRVSSFAERGRAANSQCAAIITRYTTPLPGTADPRGSSAEVIATEADTCREIRDFRDVVREWIRVRCLIGIPSRTMS